jgi:urease accessory protein
MKREHTAVTAMALAALVLANPAYAHHAMGGALPQTFSQGLLSGLAHPIIGLDHLAFLLMVALLSAPLGGLLRWLVPLAFVGATVGGTFAHIAAADFPMSEAVVALSALMGGLLVLTKRDVPGIALTLGATAFGLFHGYALGESIVGAEPTPLVAYLIGFAAIQFAVVFGGARAFATLARRSSVLSGRARMAGGALATVAGVAFLVTSLT